MSQAICYDINDKVLQFFYQWDVNQVFKINGINTVAPISVHFSNKKMDNALVVNPNIVDGIIVVEIPNILLTYNGILQVYVYQDTDSNLDGEYDGAKTICSFCIPIRPRQKPDDYFYSNNVEYISVKEKIKELENNLAVLQNELSQIRETLKWNII